MVPALMFLTPPLEGADGIDLGHQWYEWYVYMYIDFVQSDTVYSIEYVSALVCLHHR
jgi:hypothetical protein